MTRNTQLSYQDALDYIYSFVDFSRTHQENLSHENFDLSRMVKFMDCFESPHLSFPSIHIAGSKGKGSVSAYCASVLETAGYKVGLYTSPHLKDFEERIQINQIPIARETLAEYVEEIKPAVESVPELTTFEIMTGLAFLYFARQKVDLAVIEVGLGGRLDATNIITPLVSVITSLYLDHISILGDTIEKIAAEKGGIIKPGIPVVSAPQEAKAMQVICDIARNNEAPLIKINEEYPYQIVTTSLEGQKFRFENPAKTSLVDQEFLIPLLGSYQVLNAVTAIAAIQVLQEKDFPLDIAEIRRGLAKTNWPARFEIVRREPPVVIDSAHNPASMGKLRETVDQFFPNRKMILVFGISEDKQLEGMYKEILPRTAHLICTQADHPRAMDPYQLAARAEGYPCQTEVIPLVREALDRAVKLGDNGNLVLVAGSIFVAASARVAWFEGGIS